MEEAIFDPDIPYIGPIYSGQFNPGKVIKIQGTIPVSAYRFNIVLQCGPETVPRDDVALQMTVRLLDGYVSLNSLTNGVWGEQQRGSAFSVKRGENFEITLVCDYNQYKILINGQHYSAFPKRIPHDCITHLAIEGDISVVQICYESCSNELIDGPPAYSAESDLDVVQLIDPSPLPEIQAKLPVSETGIEKSKEAEMQKFTIAEAEPLNPNNGVKISNTDKFETVDQYYWHKLCGLLLGVIICIIIIFAIVISQADERPVIIKWYNSTNSNETNVSNVTIANNDTFTTDNIIFSSDNDAD